MHREPSENLNVVRLDFSSFRRGSFPKNLTPVHLGFYARLP